ncbi:MAG: heme exporter protein CcmB [Actinomycetota bacterium]
METSFSTSDNAAAAADNWWLEARAVFLKDLQSELRTRVSLSSIAVYAATTMLLVAYLVTTTGFGLTQVLVDDPKAAILTEATIYQDQQTATRAGLLASLYWVIIYFSAMAGLPRIFIKEEEMRTAAALRLAARPLAVFLGKLTFNLLLIAGISVLLLPLFLLFFQPQVASYGQLLVVLIAGATGLASGATLLGAMAARAGSHSYLLVVLGFGPLLPILILGINGTAAALQGTGGNNLAGLVSYQVALVALSALLFDKVWAE